jgi:hypothetical protein
MPSSLRNFLRRVRARSFQDIENELRAEIERLHGDIAGLHQTISLLREEISLGRADCSARVDGLRAESSARVDKLELVLTEHPNVEATSFDAPSFPSPAVSIVMPTWNRGAVIGAAIRSVQAQQFSDWELIVVDDGSTDDTERVFASFATDVRIRTVTQAHGGQCEARNNALRLAKGALIAYLDSDNLWYPGYLAAAVAVFAAHPDVGCAYGAMITESHIPGQRILFEPFDRDRLLNGNYIGMSPFIHRRSLFERYGGFDEELSALEDWDLILRYTADAPARRLPVPAVRYRVVDDKRVTVTQPMHEADARVRSKWKPA